MQQQKTIYQLIVDKSGSMSDCIDNTIRGFNDQVAKIKSMEREFPHQRFTMGLTTFNNEVVHQISQAAPSSIKPLTHQKYHPDGATALLDAIGITVTRLEGEIHTNSTIEAATVVVVILTDGYENASIMFNLADIRALISRLEETGKWTFSFIGATLDAMDVAEKMSIKRNNSYSFDKSQMNSEVWDKLSNSMDTYINKKISGKDLGNLFEE
jgi:hypothetical protein